MITGINGTQALTVDSQIWFKQSTHRINQLKVIEDSIVEQLLVTSNDHYASVQFLMCFTIDGAAILILLSTVLSWLCCRLLLLPAERFINKGLLAY